MSDTLADAYGVVVRAALRGRPMYESVARTPERAARAILEMTDGYDADIEALFTTFDGEGYDEMVVERAIPFVSLCEHHLLPFTGTAAIAYVPNGRIVGLSKLARLVDAYARRLQVQERLTRDVAAAIERYLHPQGSMVVIAGEHACMACRGVRKPGVEAITSAVHGIIKWDGNARGEALALMGFR